jgi:MFS family permease
VSAELEAEGEAARGGPYAWYVVGVLTLAYVSAFVDRQILGLLVAPIRRDLGIGDTAMSLLLGLSFAVFFTILGIPIARVADGRSRRAVIAGGIGMWSLMTALCGLTRTYGQLFLARVGVGVGEAALAPPAYSMLADYFPRRQLATAVSVFSLGIYLGAGVANLIGGAVVEAVSRQEMWTIPVVGAVRPWQTVFLAVAVPGLFLAALMATVREPARVGTSGETAATTREVWRYLRDHARAFGFLTLGTACISMVNYGTAAWLPTFLIRTYGWTAGRAGTTLGALTATVGVAGVVVGGRYADRLLAAGRVDAKVHVVLVGAVGNIVCGVLYTLAPNDGWAIAALVPFNFFAAFPFGASAAAVQELVPPRMRAQASAIYLLGLNLIGLGLGPTAVALLTDYVFGADRLLRYSLLVLTAAGLGGAALLLGACREPYRASIARRT